MPQLCCWPGPTFQVALGFSPGFSTKPARLQRSLLQIFIWIQTFESPWLGRLGAIGPVTRLLFDLKPSNWRGLFFF
jgi:hypothetical protein